MLGLAPRSNSATTCFGLVKAQNRSGMPRTDAFGDRVRICYLKKKLVCILIVSYIFYSSITFLVCVISSSDILPFFFRTERCPSCFEIDPSKHFGEGLTLARLRNSSIFLAVVEMGSGVVLFICSLLAY